MKHFIVGGVAAAGCGLVYLMLMLNLDLTYSVLLLSTYAMIGLAGLGVNYLLVKYVKSKGRVSLRSMFGITLAYVIGAVGAFCFGVFVAFQVPMAVQTWQITVKEYVSTLPAEQKSRFVSHLEQEGIRNSVVQSLTFGSYSFIILFGIGIMSSLMVWVLRRKINSRLR